MILKILFFFTVFSFCCHWKVLLNKYWTFFFAESMKRNFYFEHSWLKLNVSFKLWTKSVKNIVHRHTIHGTWRLCIWRVNFMAKRIHFKFLKRTEQKKTILCACFWNVNGIFNYILKTQMLFHQRNQIVFKK